MQEINDLIDIGRHMWSHGSLLGQRIITLADRIASDLGDLTRCHDCEKWFEEVEEVFDGSDKYCANCADKWRHDVAQEADTRSALNQVEFGQ